MSRSTILQVHFSPTVGVGNSGFNGTYKVSDIVDAKNFVTDQIEESPGVFTNDTSQRDTSLPTFSRDDLTNNYYIYDVEDNQ